MQFKLNNPIDVLGEDVCILNLRRPKVRDLKAMDKGKGDIERATLLIAEITGVPVSSVEQIDAGDFARLSEALSDFLDVYPPTGAASAPT